MGIEIASSFERKSTVPIDETALVADLTARDAIAAGIRYDGFIVYVISEQTNFQLIGGITNSDWAELSGGGGGGLATVETITATTSLTEDPDRTNRTIYVDATAGAVVITLPPASATTPGTKYRFKRTDLVEANTVTINRAGTDTIDEGNAQTLPFQWSRMTIEGLSATSWGVF